MPIRVFWRGRRIDSRTRTWRQWWGRGQVLEWVGKVRGERDALPGGGGKLRVIRGLDKDYLEGENGRGARWSDARSV